MDKDIAATPTDQFQGIPRLVVTTPAGSFTVLLTTPSLTLGRSSDSDIQVNVELISAAHARLERVNDTYKFIQIGRTNPTFYAGMPVDERLLQDGDVLRIGPEEGPNVTLLFQKAQVPSKGTPEATFVARPAQRLEPGRFFGAVSLVDRPSLTIGRDPANDLVLESMHVSRRHAVIDQGDGKHVLRDLHSTNGTFVNGYRVDERILAEGDIVRIGPYRLTYQVTEIRGYDEERSVRLDAKQITKKIGPILILEGISLSVLPGELAAIVGTSGSGKSTLMDALNGVRPASSGRVLVNGADLYRHFDAIRPLLGYVPQFSTLHDLLPLERALYYTGRLRFPQDVEDEAVWQRVREVMAALEIDDRARVAVGHLSGGQQKRASIAAELMTEPGLFFLDEPTTGLDPGLTRKLMDIIRKLADEGRTVILVTHDTESLSLCDLMVFLVGGRVAYVGQPSDAPRYFGVRDLGEVYSKAETAKSPAVWEEECQQSPEFDQYIRSRQVDAPEAERAQVMGDEAVQPVLAKSRQSAWRQWLLLVRRYLELLFRDPRTLALLILQAPIIAGLLDLTSRRNAMAMPSGFTEDILDRLPEELKGLAIPALPLLMVASVTWFGSINAAREIVKEIPVFRRERLAGLRILPYILSKVAVLGGLCILQTTLFFGVVAARVDMGEALDPSVSAGVILNPYAEIYITLLLTCFAAMGLGLLISASSPNPDRAMSLVPILLIPQLIFARVGADSHEVVQWIAYLSISRWALQAMGSTVGLPGGDFDHTALHIGMRWLGLAIIAGLLMGTTLVLLVRRRLA